MVDVSLRHKPVAAVQRAAARFEAAAGRGAAAPWVAAGLTAAVLAAAAVLYFHGQQQGAIDLVSETTPVSLSVAGHALRVPANMLRTARLRAGGNVERVDLVLHWPGFEGYSDRYSADFDTGDPRAPVVYASIGQRDAPLDATARLDTVYARFFTGKAVAGPAGLVGRSLSPESGFGGEVIYFVPSAPQPFVARCLAVETEEVPATCLRDINLSDNLSILVRFDRNLLGQWPRLEAGVRRLVATVVTN